MKIQLSEHFTYTKFIKFIVPSIIMMIFTSIYGIVDGLFVSNFVGKTAFAALNLIWPFPMLLGSIGFMFGTGGSAIVAKTLGEVKKATANRYFSMIIYTTIILGVAASVLGIVFIEKIAHLLGADEAMMHNCVIYGRILLIGLPAFMMQNVFQSFLITAERPDLGLYVTIAAGITNMVLDAVLVGILKWGISGAGYATILSQFVGAIVPLYFFVSNKNAQLKLTKTKLDFSVLAKATTNGSSELLTNMSLSLVNILYNFQLMKFVGENGVAAYGVIMYVAFIFIAIFLGFSFGSAPIISFNYGANNTAELKNVFNKSIKLIGIFSVVITVIAISLSGVLSKIFVGYDEQLLNLTIRGLKLYSMNFLFVGFNIFASSFFTALNNGLVSAIISFFRTLLLQVVTVLILPEILGVDGIWIAIVVAEAIALIVSVSFLYGKRKVYKYM